MVSIQIRLSMTDLLVKPHSVPCLVSVKLQMVSSVLLKETRHLDRFVFLKSLMKHLMVIAVSSSNGIWIEDLQCLTDKHSEPLDIFWVLPFDLFLPQPSGSLKKFQMTVLMVLMQQPHLHKTKEYFPPISSCCTLNLYLEPC